MDVKSLFDGKDQIPELDINTIDRMADMATTYPQHRVAANENILKIRKIAAVAAIIFTLLVSAYFAPSSWMNNNSHTQNGEAYEDITDLILLETLNDLS